eukprot:826535-Rhodomonas_salina.2
MDDADVLVYLGFVVWGVAVLLESLSGLDMMTIAAGNFHAAVIVDPQPHDIACVLRARVVWVAAASPPPITHRRCLLCFPPPSCSPSSSS